MPSKPDLRCSVLFPDWKESPESWGGGYGWDGKPSYDAIMDAFGTILDQESDGSYQGDTFAVIEREGEYGWLTFGWGSCSGCDALEGASEPKDVDSLMESLWSGIVWHPSKEALHKWLFEREWDFQWSWHSEGCKKLLRRVLGENDWAKFRLLHPDVDKED